VLPDASGAGGARGEWVSPMTANGYGVGGRAGKPAFGGVAGGREFTGWDEKVAVMWRGSRALRCRNGDGRVGMEMSHVS
jgi:hypothetical protein